MPACASRCGWSRARTGTPRSSARRCRVWRIIRCSRARRTPTCRISPAPAHARRRRQGRRAVPDVRHAQRAHRRGHRRARDADAGSRRDAFEFQRLHGMGEALYDEIVSSRQARHRRAASTRRSAATRTCCRTWCAGCSRTAPTPRSSTASATPAVPIDEIVADPVARVRAQGGTPNPALPLPRDLFAPERRNSRGVSLADQPAMAALDAAFAARSRRAWTAAPMIAAACGRPGRARDVVDPADHRRAIGAVVDAGPPQVDAALARAVAAQPAWDAAGGDGAPRSWSVPPSCIEARARRFRRAARARGRQEPRRRDRRSARGGRLLPLLRDARAPATSHNRCRLPSPTGESNELALHGRGVFACISPWNFPLAIHSARSPRRSLPATR